MGITFYCTFSFITILSGDENDLFELADTTGTLSLSCDSSMGLDKETRDRHLLKVIVIDKAGHEVSVTPALSTAKYFTQLNCQLQTYLNV